MTSNKAVTIKAESLDTAGQINAELQKSSQGFPRTTPFNYARLNLFWRFRGQKRRQKTIQMAITLVVLESSNKAVTIKAVSLNKAVEIACETAETNSQHSTDHLSHNCPQYSGLSPY